MDRETCALQHYRLTVRRIRSLRKIGRFAGKKNINTIIERCRAEAYGPPQNCRASRHPSPSPPSSSAVGSSTRDAASASAISWWRSRRQPAVTSVTRSDSRWAASRSRVTAQRRRRRLRSRCSLGLGLRWAWSRRRWSRCHSGPAAGAGDSQCFNALLATGPGRSLKRPKSGPSALRGGQEPLC